MQTSLPLTVRVLKNQWLLLAIGLSSWPASFLVLALCLHFHASSNLTSCLWLPFWIFGMASCMVAAVARPRPFLREYAVFLCFMAAWAACGVLCFKGFRYLLDWIWR
jgi:hypothetical protein